MRKQVDEHFRKDERLRKRLDIQSVLRETGVKGRYCIIHARKNGRSVSRLGLVVTRYIGGAVVRNRAKRRIREVFRRIKSHLCETADIVIRARGPIRQASYQEIACDLHRLLKRQKFLDASFPDHDMNDS